MTIDERLEKLLERHEALTQSVELIASMQQEESKKTTAEIRKLARLVRVIVLDRP